MVVRWHKLREVGLDNEYTLHNSIVLTTCVPKMVKSGADLTKFWQKQVGSFFGTSYILKKPISLPIPFGYTLKNAKNNKEKSMHRKMKREKNGRWKGIDAWCDKWTYNGWCQTGNDERCNCIACSKCCVYLTMATILYSTIDIVYLIASRISKKFFASYVPCIGVVWEACIFSKHNHVHVWDCNFKILTKI